LGDTHAEGEGRAGLAEGGLGGFELAVEALGVGYVAG
jgi:hypothetical protein